MSLAEDTNVLKRIVVVKTGKIKINGQNFDLLSQPLTAEKKNLIHLYKKLHRHMKVTKTNENDFYEWEINNNKLYLVGIYFNQSEKTNHIKKVFDSDKLEATWINGNIRIMKNSNEDIDNMSNIFTLEFKNGQCISKL